jgi:hypothetical protein
LSLDRDTDKSSLISVANPNGVNTVIEDVIDAEVLWQALNNISNNDAKLKTLLEHYDQNTEKTHPDISRKLSFLNKKNKESYELLDEFKEYLFTTEMKSIICDEYCRINKNPKNLTWISELISNID